MDRDRVRLAVLRYLRLRLFRPGEGRSALLKACNRLEVFMAEDELEWPELANRFVSMCNDEYLPWATEHKRLMKEWRAAAP